MKRRDLTGATPYVYVTGPPDVPTEAPSSSTSDYNESSSQSELSHQNFEIQQGQFNYQPLSRSSFEPFSPDVQYSSSTPSRIYSSPQVNPTSPQYPVEATTQASPRVLHNPFDDGDRPLLNERYPSRLVSSSSLTKLLKSTSHPSLSGSSQSPPPILSYPQVEDDYSPFGGFPAQSFPLYMDETEPDDYLHNPDPQEELEYDKNRFMHDLKHMDRRSFAGLLAFIGLLIGGLLVFILIPVLTYAGLNRQYVPETYEILTQYKYPLLSGIRTSLVDPDTPQEALSRKSVKNESWPLVFSDEFNVEGRTFYPGDDQFFTAPDLHYDATKDLEWYDPDAVTTANGTVTLRMDAFKNHDLFYRSGMLQSWNQMCFTEGILEISARLPNYGSISGLWPGLWTMGNLGRPGYLATTEGVWPYTYNSCDAGITANQSSPDGISFLPGQRLNSCTCKGESHPNPGTGRGAVEVDALEGEVSNNLGRASQSLQVAPYDIWYYPDYSFVSIYNSSITTMNKYTGGPFQQAISATTALNLTWYEHSPWSRNFQRYGFEVDNNDDDGYLTWFVGMDRTLTIQAQALHPNGNVGWRQLPKEPMSIIMNLGVSNNWAYIDWAAIHFPVTMNIDYVRIYQPPGKTNLGCDPADYPTYNYIQEHLNIYSNSNLTSFAMGGYKMPKNSLVNGCNA